MFQIIFHEFTPTCYFNLARPRASKLQKKFSFVATVSDMPDVITWKVMPLCARHL
jgi:hypothetical protein